MKELPFFLKHHIKRNVLTLQKIKNIMETVRLYNGVEMPVLGYGVFQVSPEECERCVSDAISVGYRLIDTAQAYRNEKGVGNAIAKCGVPRNELFIVTKVWISNAGYERQSPDSTRQRACSSRTMPPTR